MRKVIWGGLTLVSVSVLSLTSIPYWLSASQAISLANHFLPTNYQLEATHNWQLSYKGLTLPTLQIKGQTCQVAQLQNLQLTWWPIRHLTVAQTTLDYPCLQQQLPQNSEQSNFNLAMLFSLLPNAEVELEKVQLQSLDAPTNPLMAQLFMSDWSLYSTYAHNSLQLRSQAKLQNQLIFQQQAALTQQNGQFHWHSQTDYQPDSAQIYHLNVNTPLSAELNRWPQQGAAELTWTNPDWSVPKGNLNLQWGANKGQINAQNLADNSPLLDVPFTFNQDGIEITWGKFYWTFDGYQPIRGFLGLALHKSASGFWPLKSDLNIILQTFGEQGKGEIVISGKDALIGAGDKQDELHFELTTKGDLRYNSNVAHTNLQYRILGHFNDPLLHFLKGSIFKMDHLEDQSKIHVRLPLDDILVGRYGLDGRLQARLQGTTAQFRDLDLKLDGQAHEFIAGIKTLFELRDERHKLRNAELRAANRWDWQVSGNAYWKSLETPIQMQGEGFWEDDHIELNKLTANSQAIAIEGVKMAPLSLVLRDRLRWDYEQQHLRGLLQAKTDWIEFAYGGRFVTPIFSLGVDGESIGNFNLAGDLKAGGLGPLNVQAHYQHSRLTGSIGWREQSAKVFQSLFPAQWEWLIRSGSIKGNSQFVIDSEKVALDGELQLSKGEIEFPDGELHGLNIHFPLHYQNFDLHADKSAPIRVNADNMRYGALHLAPLSLAISGHYPNTAKHPLTLRNVNIGLFDGKLSVPELDFPQHEEAVLRLDNIDLAQVLDMAQYQQLAMRGRVNVRLPFWLGHSKCLICQGTIEQATPLYLQLNEKVVAGLKSGGWTETMLVDLLKEMELQQSHASFDLLPNGQMTLDAQLRGKNPQHQTYHPITLNYRHQENMFELWKMIDYGSQFEQNLQYRLYRNLEK